MCNTYIYDIEGDGLLDQVTKFHCMVFKEDGNDSYRIFVEGDQVERAKKWVESTDLNAAVYRHEAIEHLNDKTIVCHNQYGYDLPAIDKILGVDLTWNNQIKDTLVMSRYLNPNRRSHGLAYWGQRLANKKPEVEDWENQPLEVYLHRCVEDVKITQLTYDFLQAQMDKAQGNLDAGLALAHVVYRDLCKQERDGACFDTGKAKQTLVNIEQEMVKLEEEVEPQLGTFTLPKSKQPTWPAKPFKKDGSISQSGFNYGAKFGIKEEDELKKLFKGGQPLVLTGDIKLANQDALKKFLVEELGWKPTIWGTRDITRSQDKRNHPEEVVRAKARAYADEMWQSLYKEYWWKELELPKKYQNNPNTLSDKDVERLIGILVRKGRNLPTTPQYRDPQSKALCINLEELEGEMAKSIVRWLSLRNRAGVVRGWLDNSRVTDGDGRLGAGVGGLANTHRQRHHTVVNVPKADPDVVYGKEMRELFIAPGGMVCVGCDAAALENRVAAHFSFDYDGGSYAKEILDGDSHTKNAKAYTEAAGKEVSRSRGKNITYGTLYGAQGKRIGSMLDIPTDAGQRVVDAFWDSNLGLKLYKEDLEREWHMNGERYITGLDGRFIPTRSKHSLVNAAFQSAGAVIMDMAWAIAVNKLDFSQCQRWGYFHDEYQVYATPEYADECGKILEESIRLAGEAYNLNVPLEGEYMKGNNWAEVH